MEQWNAHACPDDTVLAAYAEGKVDQRTGHAIEDHVAECEECDSVLAATLVFLGQHKRRRTPWWIAAAAVAVFLIAIPAWRVARRDPIAPLREAAAMAPTRVIEGHLADFEHRPYHPSRSASSASADLRIRALAARLTRQHTARAFHARGVASLLMGDPASASKALLLAATREPENARYWNDLAAAYLELGSRSDFRSALAAADKAMAISPSLASAHFNRAVALQHLGRRTDAIASYGQAALVESSAEWRDEARTRRRRLDLTRR
jgi:tetratricopeptide (TPR) repeat protein